MEKDKDTDKIAPVSSSVQEEKCGICPYIKERPSDWQHCWPLTDGKWGSDPKTAKWLRLRNSKPADWCLGLFDWLYVGDVQEDGTFFGLFKSADAIVRAMPIPFGGPDSKQPTPLRNIFRIPIFVTEDTENKNEKRWEWAFTVRASGVPASECMLWVESFPESWGKPVTAECNQCFGRRYSRELPLTKGLNDPWLKHALPFVKTYIRKPTVSGTQKPILRCGYSPIEYKIEFDVFCSETIRNGPDMPML